MSTSRARSFLLAAFLAAALFVLAPAARCVGAQQTAPTKHTGPACMTASEAAQPLKVNKDVCVSAHIYDVVELADGTRFLDVCPPDQPDDQCRFTFLSLRPDRDDVGDLRRYRNQNVEVRGILRATHGRMGILISHVRQFSGGPEKFRPNPKLLRDFSGQSDRMPVQDPNLVNSGHHRSFMNTADKEALPKQNH